MKRFTSKTQRTGEIGEKICLQYVLEKGFEVLDQNYTKPCGEIDIIMEKYGKIHFIEVKSSKIYNNVSHETYNPAENLTRKKLQKIYETIMMYLEENSVSHETPWQIDLYCVYIDTLTRKHKIQVLENIN